MNPWEEELVVINEQPVVETSEVMPWEEDLSVKTPRGANVGGALRNVAQATPFLGTRADEIEGAVRSLIEGGDYEMWRKNAEESALGNIENTGYGRGLELGTNLTENAILTAMLRGKNLTPTVSALQGAIEGSGRGKDSGERFANALLGAGIGYVVPAAFNRIFPTQSVQKYALEKTAKSRNPLTQLVAKAIKGGTTPEDIIVKETPKGMLPDLWARLRRAATGENVFRKSVLESASENVSKPYSRYIEEEVRAVSPKYASKIGNEIEKYRLDDLGEDIVGMIDPRQYVMDAVNKVMRNASNAEREAVSGVLANAIARRGTAKKLVSTMIERPISLSGSFLNIGRRLVAPIKNLSNLGLARELTVGTPNYVATPLAERLLGKTFSQKAADLLNNYTPDVVRGALDALVEKYEIGTVK